MSFNHGAYAFLALILCGVISWFFTRSDKKYFEWVNLYWFYKRSMFEKIASTCILLGLCILLFASLDLRGPEEQVEGKSQNQKTIILIDSSSSMLAEDVRPNRFKKALLLVKHYIKKAVGQQISIIVFSDGQKRIVPFTEDIDLLEARINTLEKLQLNRGGTGLRMAIQESLQHFKIEQKEPVGNILLLTDAEETEGGVNLDIPDTVSLGVIGIGTAKGAPIPKRNRQNVFMGNKKHKGKVVISKLDENFLKKLSEQVAHYRYWIATSYSLPTEEILSFFLEKHKAKEGESLYRIRPVLAWYLFAPAFILFIIGYIFKLFPSYTALLFVLFLNDGQANIQLPNQNEEAKGPTKSEFTLSLESALKRNDLDKKGRLKLAESLLKEGFPDEAKILYEEELTGDIDKDGPVDSFNYATSLAHKGDIKGSIKKFNELLKRVPKDKNNEMRKAIKKNIAKLFEESEKQKNKQKSEDGGEGSEGDDQNEDKEGESGENKDQKDKEDESGDDEKKDDSSEKEDQSDNKNDSKDNSNKNVDKKKIPAIVKQLMSDDNQLQKKMIDAKTSKRKSSDRKDW